MMKTVVLLFHEPYQGKSKRTLNMSLRLDANAKVSLSVAMATATATSSGSLRREASMIVRTSITSVILIMDLQEMGSKKVKMECMGDAEG